MHSTESNINKEKTAVTIGTAKKLFPLAWTKKTVVNKVPTIAKEDPIKLSLTKITAKAIKAIARTPLDTGSSSTEKISICEKFLMFSPL